MNIALPKIARPMQIAGATLAIFTASSLTLSAKAEEVTEQKLAIYVDDLQGEGWTSVINAREELMRQAIDEVVTRNDWIEEYEFEYNTVPEESESGYVTLNIIEWERTRSNFYNFSAAVSFVDADGKKHDLGTFRGTRSGISVINNRDSGEVFAQVAEDALNDAFEALKSETGYSS